MFNVISISRFLYIFLLSNSCYENPPCSFDYGFGSDLSRCIIPTRLCSSFISQTGSFIPQKILARALPWNLIGGSRGSKEESFAIIQFEHIPTAEERTTIIKCRDKFAGLYS
jgi:hypothetical protein